MLVGAPPKSEEHERLDEHELRGSGRARRRRRPAVERREQRLLEVGASGRAGRPVRSGHGSLITS
jgi:hypothetical protein